MDPIRHPQASVVLGAPPNWDHSNTECVGLPVAQVERDGMPLLESFWRPSAEELAALVAGRPVVLQVVGLNHPVVSLGVLAYAPSPARDERVRALLDLLHAAEASIEALAAADPSADTAALRSRFEPISANVALFSDAELEEVTLFLAGLLREGV